MGFGELDWETKENAAGGNHLGSGGRGAQRLDRGEPKSRIKPVSFTET